MDTSPLAEKIDHSSTASTASSKTQSRQAFKPEDSPLTWTRLTWCPSEAACPVNVLSHLDIGCMTASVFACASTGSNDGEKASKKAVLPLRHASSPRVTLLANHLTERSSWPSCLFIPWEAPSRPNNSCPSRVRCFGRPLLRLLLLPRRNSF